MSIKNNNSTYAAVFIPAEEGGYTVTVPALPGCISEGDSFEEAKTNITEAITLYLSTVKNFFFPANSEFIVAPVQVG